MEDKTKTVEAVENEEEAKKMAQIEQEVSQILEEMDKSDFSAQKEAILKKVDKLIATYNDCLRFAEFKRMRDVRARLDDYVKEYNGVARVECFAALKKSPDPIEAAARVLYYDVIKMKENKEKGVVTSLCRVDDKKMIDLIGLDKYCGGIGVGADIDGKHLSWVRVVENTNRQFAFMFAAFLGVDPVTLDGYKISDDANLIPFLKDFGSLTTKEDRENAVNAAIDAVCNSVQDSIDAMFGVGEDGSHFCEVDDRDIRSMIPRNVKPDNKNYLVYTIKRYNHMAENILALVNKKIENKSFSIIVTKFGQNG